MGEEGRLLEAEKGTTKILHFSPKFSIFRIDFNEKIPEFREISQIVSKSLDFCTKFA